MPLRFWVVSVCALTGPVIGALVRTRYDHYLFERRDQRQLVADLSDRREE